jgi:RNA polymerase sigma-70 factor, ECF subfamily
VLILRDVLGWPAKDTAGLLDTSVAAVNSALQRARPVLKERLPSHRRDWTAEPGQDEGRVLLRRYIDAFEQSDPGALAELLREDVLLTMPPEPVWWHGRSALMSSFSQQVFDPGVGAFLARPAMINRQPAAALYLRRPGDTAHRAQGLNILRVEEGRVAEITAFYADRFPSLGLPMTL